jgi:hypothetical protein
MTFVFVYLFICLPPHLRLASFDDDAAAPLVDQSAKTFPAAMPMALAAPLPTGTRRHLPRGWRRRSSGGEGEWRTAPPGVGAAGVTTPPAAASPGDR